MRCGRKNCFLLELEAEGDWLNGGIAAGRDRGPARSPCGRAVWGQNGRRGGTVHRETAQLLRRTEHLLHPRVKPMEAPRAGRPRRV